MLMIFTAVYNTQIILFLLATGYEQVPVAALLYCPAGACSQNQRKDS